MTQQVVNITVKLAWNTSAKAPDFSYTGTSACGATVKENGDIDLTSCNAPVRLVFTLDQQSRVIEIDGSKYDVNFMSLLSKDKERDTLWIAKAAKPDKPYSFDPSYKEFYNFDYPSSAYGWSVSVDTLNKDKSASYFYALAATFRKQGETNEALAVSHREDPQIRNGGNTGRGEFWDPLIYLGIVAALIGLAVFFWRMKRSRP